MRVDVGVGRGGKKYGADEKKLLQALFPDSLEAGLLRHRTVRHDALASTQVLCDGKWTVTRCEACQLNCCAIDKGGRRVVMSPSLLRGPAVDRLRADTCFSEAFAVVVKTKSHSIMANHTSNTTALSKSLLSHANEEIEREMLEMEARIQHFVRQQKEEHKQFRQHIMSELRELSLASSDSLANDKPTTMPSFANTSYAPDSPANDSHTLTDSLGSGSGWSSEQGSGSDSGFGPFGNPTLEQFDGDDDDEGDIFQLEEDVCLNHLRIQPSSRDEQQNSDEDSDEDADDERYLGLGLGFKRLQKPNQGSMLSSSLPLAIPPRLAPRKPRKPSTSDMGEGEGDIDENDFSPDEAHFMPPHTIADFDFYSARRGDKDDATMFERAVLHQSLSLRSSNML